MAIMFIKFRKSSGITSGSRPKDIESVAGTTYQNGEFAGNIVRRGGICAQASKSKGEEEDPSHKHGSGPRRKEVLHDRGVT